MNTVQKALKEYEQRQKTAAQTSSAKTPQSSVPGVQAALNEYQQRNSVDSETYKKYTTARDYIGSFLRDSDSFFSNAQRDSSTSKPFDAAEFFEERKQQADILKNRGRTALQYLEDAKDLYSYADYLDLKDILSGVETNVDDVLGYYQQSRDAKTGMRAYEDEMLAAMERNERFANAVGRSWNVPFGMTDSMNPIQSLADMANRNLADANYYQIGDQWTDEQRYRLGRLQMENPEEARKYARDVNRGEDPFVAYAEQQKAEESLRNLDIAAAEKELAGLEAELEAWRWGQGAERFNANDPASRRAWGEKLEEQEKRISDKKREINQARHIQEGDAYAAIVGNPDFTEKSGYVSTAHDFPVMYGDYQIDYKDPVYEYINNTDGVRESVGMRQKALANKGYDLMTEEEVGIYNYLYATEGKEKAQAYLDNIQESLNERKGAEIFEQVNESTARELLFGAGAGLNQFGEGLINLFNTEDNYIAPSPYQVAAGMVREDLGESSRKLPEFMGGGTLSQVGFDLINTTANMAPSIITSMGLSMFNPALGKVAGSALMGASAAGSAYQEALNSGYSKEQARAYSALVGGSEVGLEYLLGGISSLGGVIPDGVLSNILSGVDNAIARAAIDLGGSMASEGFEEGLQEVLTPWFKNLTLMADENVNWNEVAYSTLLGALSALPMETPGAVRDAWKGSISRNSETAANDAEEGRVPDAVFSDDGMARQISADKPVNVLDFNSVNNGKATIQLEDGGTAEYNDIMFASEQQANQFRAIASLPGLDTESANLALHAVMDANAGADVDSLVGIRDAYGKGYGFAQESDLASGYSASISPQLRKTLFDIGRSQRSTAIPTTRTASTAPSKGYKKVVLEGKNVKIVPHSKQDAEVRYMDYIAENFSGTAVHVYKSKKGMDGKLYYWDSNGKRRKAPNGMYVNGEIWVDLNAGNKGEGLVLNTFAHEMYHHIKKYSPQKANELAEFVVKELGLESAESAVAAQIAKARSAGYGESYYRNERNMTPEQARNAVEQTAWEDFIADSLETMFTKGDPAKAIADLKNENRGLFDEIKKFVDKWVKKLKEFYSGKTISEEGAAVSQLENFEKIQKLFMEAMEDAGKNYTAAEVLTPGEDGYVVNEAGDPVAMDTEDGSAMLSIRTYEEDGRKVSQATGDLEDSHRKYSYENLPSSAFYENGDIYRYEFLAAQDDMRVTDKLPDLKDLQTNGKVDAEKVVEAGFNNVLKSGGKKTGNTYQITNVYTGRYLQIGKTSITHGLGNNINSLRTNARLGAVIGELCKNAIPLNGVPNTHNVRGTYVMATLVNTKVNNKDMNMVALITVEQQNGKVQSVDFVDVAHAVSGRLVRDIEKENRSAQGTPPGTKSEWVTRFSTIKISDFLDIVNRTHQGYLSDDVISALNVERRGERKGLFSLRNEEVDNSPRGILMRLDASARKRDAEKEHLSRYQERVRKLEQDEARLAEVNAEIERLSEDKKQNRKEILALQAQQRNLTTSVTGLKRNIKTAEQSDMFKRMVSDGRLQEYRAEQRETEKERIREYRALRKELTGTESVMDVMESEFVRLAKDLEAKKIDLKTMEAEFLRLSKEYDKQGKLAGQAKQLKEDNATWQREYNRLMREYETSGRKIERLEADIEHRKKMARERVQSRRRTEMRHKIQKKADELNKLLLKGGKERNVPIGLQKAVAAVLDSINMEVRNEEQRAKLYDATLARYDRLIATETNEAIRNDLIEKRAIYEAKGDQFAEKMKALKKAYDEIKNDEDPLMVNAYDEGLSEHLDTLLNVVGDTPLGQMNAEQLQCAYDVLNAVQATVRNANRTLASEREQGIEELSTDAMREVQAVGGSRQYGHAVVEAIRKFGWNNMKPVYAFETIGSKVLSKLYANVRKGEDTWAKDVTEARDFYLEQRKKHKADKWDMEKEYTFTSSSGMKFRLNLEQIMSLYAYAKREQAADHLRKGGIVIDETTEVTVKTKLGIKVKFNPTEATAYNINDDTLGDIIMKLTPEQRAFVDEMQSYLSDTMGAKGNEVSVKMYGIKLFKEKNYFPLRSATQFMAKAKEQMLGDVKVKNSGFTKETAPKASNPIVLTPFMQVWARHVDEMSMYHSFVLPLEDFYRVYNYRTATSEEAATRSVQMTIQNAYGKGATAYVDQLLRDLNGGARADNTTGVINTLMSKFKKGAVFASASVVIQQPSAIARAAALIDYKYFIGHKITDKEQTKIWEQMKKYAPVCIIKEMGYFDTNVGKSTIDYITGPEYSGFKEKVKAFVTDGDFRDETLSRPAALADEMTWGVIWNAVRREVNDKHPNVDVRSEQFMQMVGDRFTEVIVKTQVYDSVLSRSGNMRSKDTGMKMATAFMSEPTTSINMVADALLQAHRGGKTEKAKARKTIGAVVASVILNSFLVSWVYAARDDDEDETFREKYISSFLSNTIDGLKPATYIPFIKDIVSISQGYEVERADMSVISDLWKAWKQLKDEKLSPYRKVENFVGATCQLFGLPTKNIMRDVRAVYNTYNTLTNGEKATVYGYGEALVEALSGQGMSNAEELFGAVLTGDNKHVERVTARYESEEDAHKALESQIRENFIAGEISESEARSMLMKGVQKPLPDIYWMLKEWDYIRVNGSDEGYSRYNDLYDAVRTGDNVPAVIKRYLHNDVNETAIKRQLSQNFRDEYVQMEGAERDRVRENLVNAYTILGETEDDARYTISKWDFEADYNFSYEDRKSLYLSGEIDREELLKAMVEFGGYEKEDAEAKITEYEWDSMGYDVSAARIAKYMMFCEAAGVDKADYVKIVEFSNNTSNDVDPNTGKTIYYSAVRKVMAEIDKLNIPDSQKQAIALSLWKESTVEKYKLW